MGIVIDICAMVVAAEQCPNRIREIRKSKGLTLVELAERINVKNGTMSRIERGDLQLTLDYMRRIGRALDVTPAELLSEDDNPLAGLDAEQRFVLDTMLDDRSGAGATRALYRVSESLRDFSAEPAPDQARSA